MNVTANNAINGAMNATMNGAEVGGENRPNFSSGGIPEEKPFRNLTAQELNRIFSIIYDNHGGLTPEILSELAVGFRWDTFTVLNAVCNYINSSKKVTRGEELMAIGHLRNEKDNLAAQLKAVREEYARLTAVNTDVTNRYCEIMRDCCNLKQENEALKRKLQEKTEIETVERLISPLQRAEASYGGSFS